MLVDTDVMVWYMRGNHRAAETLARLGQFAISVVTYIELVQGLRGKAELRLLRATLKDFGIPIVPLTEEISHKAMFYVEEHFHSHSLQLADALIAATAVTYGRSLVTANEKHFRSVGDLQIERFKP